MKIYSLKNRQKNYWGKSKIWWNLFFKFRFNRIDHSGYFGNDFEGYSLNGIEKDESTYVIDLKSISPTDNVSDDMGRYFCYYLEVTKDVNMTGATIKY